jgi:hypothetical protein
VGGGLISHALRAHAPGPGRPGPALVRLPPQRLHVVGVGVERDPRVLPVLGWRVHCWERTARLLLEAARARGRGSAATQDARQRGGVKSTNALGQ